MRENWKSLDNASTVDLGILRPGSPLCEARVKLVGVGSGVTAIFSNKERKNFFEGDEGFTRGVLEDPPPIMPFDSPRGATHLTGRRWSNVG